MAPTLVRSTVWPAKDRPHVRADWAVHPDVWTAACCDWRQVVVDYPALTPHGASRGVVAGGEQAAVRLLASHLAEEHQVMIIRSLVVTDVRPCLGEHGDGCLAVVLQGIDPPCEACDNAEVITHDRVVPVDLWTVEADR